MFNLTYLHILWKHSKDEVSNRAGEVWSQIIPMKIPPSKKQVEDVSTVY